MGSNEPAVRSGFVRESCLAGQTTPGRVSSFFSLSPLTQIMDSDFGMMMGGGRGGMQRGDGTVPDKYVLFLFAFPSNSTCF